MSAKKHKGPYIPRADGKFRDWLNNFAAVLAASPGQFNVSPAEVAKVTAAANQYETAYIRATSPETRCPPATAAKNAARRKAWSTARPMAMRIRAIPGIADALVIRLGVYPRQRKQAPIRPPKRTPLLMFERAIPGGGGGMHRLRVQDPAHPSRWAKPPGVVYLQLYVIVSKSKRKPPALPPMISPTGRRTGPVRSGGKLKRGEREFIFTATRHVFNVPFLPQDAGKVATHYGRWVTKRGLTGPWSAPVSMTVP